MSRQIKLIVIHCSASPDGVSLFTGRPGDPVYLEPVQVVDGWHEKRGFHRKPEWRAQFNPQLGHIGYHFLIYTSGAIVSGRHLDEVGAHVVGQNLNSIGVSQVGTDKFTRAQWKSLAAVIDSLQRKYPGASVVGHRDLSPDLNHDGTIEKWEWLKTCPGFDVAPWLARGMQPDPAHVFDPEPATTA